jgi:phospholipase C
MHRPRRLLVVGVLVVAAGAFTSMQLVASATGPPAAATPVKHLVVIFDENVSFDHYFGTYPNAANLPGETAFSAAGGTPTPENLQSPTNLLAPFNPNSSPPSRQPPSDVIPCGNDHTYRGEQVAFDTGLMDKFATGSPCSMGYYDGNTVTGLWNLAQHFTMSDNYFGTTFGPSTPGAINLISGNTHGATTASGAANGTMIGDPDPLGDDCGAGSNSMTGTTVGDLMNTAGMTWGWFQGGFRPTSVDGSGKATCGSTHKNAGGATITDYSAHHEPFQYYASTANPHHLPPSSAAMIGQSDQANHQYDLTDFDTVVQNGSLPQVSFLKAAAFEDGHPGNSGPVDEQRWIANVLDELEQSPQWADTAVIITYDDSDGWYDHKFVTPTQGSDDATNDALNAGGTSCGPAPGAGDFKDRCGPGPRLPLLIVSPWVAPNTLHHTQREQTSIVKFIEDNWLSGQRIGNQSFDQRANTLDTMFDFNLGDTRAPKVYLDPSNGTLIATPPAGASASPSGLPPTTTTSPPPTTTASTTNLTPPPPTTTKAPPPKPTPFKPKLSFSTKKTSKTLKLSFKVTGLSTKRGKITVSAKLTLGKKAIASGKGTVRSGRLTLTLKSKKKLKRGTYKLSMTVSQAGKSAKFSKTLKLH